MILVITAAILTVQSSSMLQPSYAQLRLGESLDRDSQTALLDLHNREREAVGVPPLTWSDSLATEAQNWAEEIESLRLRLDLCAQDSSQCPPPSNTNQGENIAWGPYPGREYRAASLAESWADERRNYVPGTPIEPRFGYPEGVYGHYTQMVWGRTAEIGCGFVERDFSILVCRYAPGGNWIGGIPYDAPPPPPATNATAAATNATAAATNATAAATNAPPPPPATNAPPPPPATNAPPPPPPPPATNAPPPPATNAPPPPATNAPPPVVGEEQNTTDDQGAVQQEVGDEFIQEVPPQ
jgi:hypothetical protein